MTARVSGVLDAVPFAPLIVGTPSAGLVAAAPHDQAS
jgi:hypothetical protein